MGRASRVRVEATEYVASGEVMRALVGAGMASTEAVAVLARTAARLRRALHLPEGDGPIAIDGENVKASGIAGVVRLAAGVELDIAPKFLGFEHPAWREDLLAISNYTHRGSFVSQQVRARIGDPGDLASVIGRAFAAEFWKHYRKPLRVYRERRWRDFSVEGELDPDLMQEQSADGLPQQAMVLDRRNPYNALIARAADVLVGDVRDAAVRAQLLRIRALLGAQEKPPRRLRPVPARHEPWADLVQLSRDVAAGSDLTLHADRYQAPGYVIRTWEAWERLAFIALRNELGFESVKAQRPHAWGSREGREIFVRPDVTILTGEETRLVDAKYRTRLDRKRRRIARDDLIEAAAFMAACDTDRIVLLYPRSAAAGDARPCGAAEVFDSVTVTPGRHVLGLDLEVRGFSARNAQREFGARLAAALDVAFRNPTVAVGELATQ